MEVNDTNDSVGCKSLNVGCTLKQTSLQDKKHSKKLCKNFKEGNKVKKQKQSQSYDDSIWNKVSMMQKANTIVNI